MPLSKYDEGPDLVLYYKYLMTLAGHKGFDRHILPTDALTEPQRASANRKYFMFRQWWDKWEGKNSLN